MSEMAREMKDQFLYIVYDSASDVYVCLAKEHEVPVVFWRDAVVVELHDIKHILLKSDINSELAAEIEKKNNELREEKNQREAEFLEELRKEEKRKADKKAKRRFFRGSD